MFTYETILDSTANVLFWLAVVMAGICLVDWLVRTRRISPFNPVARFFRRTIDPLMAPVERRIVRAGGLPSSAPGWMFVVVIVGGILLLQLLRSVADVTAAIGTALAFPSDLPRVLASWALELLKVALIVRVIVSWLPVSPTSKWVRWAYPLTEWFLGPLRRALPALGPIDISPLVAYFVLGLLQSALHAP